MQVLIVTDGAHCSQLAVRRVRTFYPTDTLVVLSVEPMPAGGLLNVGGVMGPVLVDPHLQETSTATAITDARRILGEGPDVSYRTTQGDPGATIVAVAQELDVDVIVMGSHGRDTLARLLIGSVANYVVNHATCPVLVFKSKVVAAATGVPTPPQATVIS
ncbi:MAG: universal stress protein [Candidatus Sericytochromatia bacterium]|nr:universal stress protein [Candidatus Sericytochromatia bacterium]